MRLAERRGEVRAEPERGAAAHVDDPVHGVRAVEVREVERRVGEQPLEQVEHRAGGVGERSVGRRGGDRRGLDRSDVHLLIIVAGGAQLNPPHVGSSVQMRLASFLAPGGDTPIAGEVRGEAVVAFASGSVRDRLASGDRTPAAGAAYALAEVTLLAPVPRPRAIFGIGLNYLAHARETGKEPPPAPIVFMKLPTSSVGPAGPVRCPAVVRRLDYEVELALVMGAGTRSRATRSPTTSRRATCRSASRSGRGRRAPTRSARGDRG